MSEKLKHWVRGMWFDWKNRNVPRGYCCCGSPVDSHGYGDGHSPIEDYGYYRDLYVRGAQS